MAFKTPFSPHNAWEGIKEQRETPIYTSPFEAMKASLKMAGDPSINSTFAIADAYNRFNMEYFPEGEYKFISAKEANEKFQPMEAYTEPVREDLATFDYQAREANRDLEMIMGSVNPNAMGSTVMPMTGMLAAGFADPVGIAAGILTTGGLSKIAQMASVAVKGKRILKMAAILAKYSTYKGKNVGGAIAKTLLDNAIGNIPPELIVSMRNKNIRKDPTIGEFVDNIVVGAVVGSIIELGIMGATGKFKGDTPEGVAPDPTTPEHTPAYPMDTPYQYRNLEDAAAHTIPTMEALSAAGVTPYMDGLDYSPESVSKLKEYAIAPENKYFRDIDIESELNQIIQDKVGPIQEFASVGDFDQGLFDTFLTKAEKTYEGFKKIVKKIEKAEAQEKTRVQDATTDAAQKSIDANFELRMKQTKYRQQIKKVYDSFGGDFSSLHGIAEDFMDMGIEPTPQMLQFMKEIDDAARYFGDRSKVEPLIRKPIDRVSIYREAYDAATNDILSEWGFDSEYKPLAVEARKKGVIVETVDDVDNLATLARELSPEEALETLRERSQLEPTFRKRENKRKVVADIEAKQERMRSEKKNYEEMHSALIDELKRDKHIDHLMDLMEEVELEADPSTRMELMETIEEAQKAMEEALGPEKFREMMDELTTCIRG